jgi:hypothetical protein
MRTYVRLEYSYYPGAHSSFPFPHLNGHQVSSYSLLPEPRKTLFSVAGAP